jgi:hypothetical protein
MGASVRVTSVRRPSRRGVADGHAGRHRDLVGVGHQRDGGVDPVAVVAQVVVRAGGRVFQRRHAQFGLQPLLAALGCGPAAAAARFMPISGAISMLLMKVPLSTSRRWPLSLRKATSCSSVAKRGARLARLQRALEAVDAVVEVGPFLLQRGAGHIQLLHLQRPHPAQVHVLQRRAVRFSMR